VLSLDSVKHVQNELCGEEVSQHTGFLDVDGPASGSGIACWPRPDNWSSALSYRFSVRLTRVIEGVCLELTAFSWSWSTVSITYKWYPSTKSSSVLRIALLLPLADGP